METLRKNQTEKLEMKNMLIKMRNVFNGLISRVNTAERRINKLEERSLKVTQTDTQKKNSKENT